MITSNRKLIIEQLDKKFEIMAKFKESEIPSKGWIYSIRTALNMTLAQLAKRLGKSVQTVREIEGREESKNITLKKLMEVAEALDLRFVYGFIPRQGSLQNVINKKSEELARNIVQRTSQTMKLEDQNVSDDRLEKAVKERADEIRKNIPRQLWD